MYSHALSDDVTLHTKKAIQLLKESNCIRQRNWLKNRSKKESILAPPRIDSSGESKFLLLVPEHTLRRNQRGTLNRRRIEIRPSNSRVRITDGTVQTRLI